jgi:hypothetical protein
MSKVILKSKTKPFRIPPGLTKRQAEAEAARVAGILGDGWTFTVWDEWDGHNFKYRVHTIDGKLSVIPFNVGGCERYVAILGLNGISDPSLDPKCKFFINPRHAVMYLVREYHKNVLARYLADVTLLQTGFRALNRFKGLE